jgi:predicted Zn finger-like uncharacterized protein
MPTTEVRCPHCQARFAVPNAMLGTVSRCGRCQQLFTPTKPGAPPAAARPVVIAPVPPPPAPPAPSKVILKPVVTTPAVPVLPPKRAPIAPPVDDEDEDIDRKLRSRRRKSEPEDEEEGGLHPALIVGLSAGVVVALGAVAFLIVRALI